MSYPNAPYGQGFPGQPGHPQQPGWPQQPGYPPAAYPGSYQPKPPGGPSGATGILAGILALLGGLVGVYYVVLAVVIVFSDRDIIGVVFGLLGTAVGVPLFLGAIMLWQRKMIGRRLVVCGCAVAILAGLAAVGDLVMGISADPTREPLAISVAVAVGLVLPIVTIVLTLLPSTTKWIQAKPNPLTPQYYPPYPG